MTEMARTKMAKIPSTGDPRRRGRVIVGSLVAATLAGVTLLPSTGWIVRQQAQATLSGSLSPARMTAIEKRTLLRQERAAAEHPDNFPLQMALARRKSAATQRPIGTATTDTVDTTDTDGKLAALQSLETTYSNQPSLYAAILRDLSRGAVKLGHRTDQEELEPPRKATDEKKDPSNSPLLPALHEWERAAVAGARLDPGNAFFPFMRAIGLFAQHRDTEALVSIRHAATLPRYEDYVRDEATGGWALAEAGQSAPLATLPRTAISAAVLLPHYAPMRASARVAVVQAIHLEQAGKAEEGFAIRQALTRIGARMRTDSNWVIGNLVGEAIAAQAQARPGGAPPLPRSVTSGKSGERAALRVKQYKAYLTRIGHPEEIAWVEHAEAAREEVRAIVGKGLDQGPSSLASQVTNVALWGGGIALLGNALWMVVLGALATGLARTRRVRSGEPLHPAVTRGMGISIVLAALVGSGALSGGLGGGFLLGILSLAVLGAIAAIPHLLRRGQSRRSWREAEQGTVGEQALPVGRSVGLVGATGATGATVASVSLLLGLLLWTSGSIVTYAYSMSSLLGDRALSSASQGAGIRLLSLALLCGLPLLMWGVLAIRSRIRRVPVSVGTVRGFARLALPMAAGLSLLYVVTVGVTSVREQAAREALVRTVEHEGRACAATWSGRAWPSFAP